MNTGILLTFVYSFIFRFCDHREISEDANWCFHDVRLGNVSSDFLGNTIVHYWTQFLNKIDIEYTCSIALVEAIVKSPSNDHICRLIFDLKDITATQRQVQKKLQENLRCRELGETFDIGFSWLLESR